MKKSLFSLVAVAGMLFATSCSSDIATDIASGDEAMVRFTVGVENVASSRAISDGLGANTLVYQIYNSDGTVLDAFTREQDDNVTFPYELTLRLVKGQSYRIAFWAQNSDCSAYDTSDLTNVTVDYAGLNNDEARDAFFNVESFTVTGDQTISSTLRRPFAQVNVGVDTEDYEAALACGIDIATSKAVISKAPNTLNLLTGEVSGETVVTYDFAKVPAHFDTPEVLKVKLTDKDGGEAVDTEFAYVSMSYILAPAEKTTVDEMTFTLHPESGSDVVLSQGLTNVPVQRNWRTNILGSFLTSEIKFYIVIDPEYYGDYNFENGEVEDHKIAEGVDFYEDTYYIYNLSGLQWFQGQVNKASNQVNSLHATIKKASNGKWIFNGQTVKLMADINLNNANWAPIGSGTGALIFTGVFDGGNHTVSNLKVSTTNDKSAGFFAGVIGTIQNLKLENVNIAGHFKTGAISGDGMCAQIKNCHVNGGTITSTPWLKDGNYDDANNVGGITGYLSAESTAYVENSSVRNVTIKAYRDVAGIAGTVGGGNAYIKDCVVEGVKIIADQTVTYVEEKAPNAGELYGRLVNAASEAKITGNTTNNVKVLVYKPENGSLTVDVTDPALLPDAKGNDDFEELVLESSMTGEATKSASYGATAILLDGITVDGKGNTITITTQNANYVSVINAKSGTAKNLNINGAVRALFVGNGVNGDIHFESVNVDNTLYAFNSDAGNKEYGVYFDKCRLNGWTSFSNVHKEVVFTDCTFGEGSRPGWNYAYCRPYNPCTFDGCEFEEGFELDPTQSSSIVLKNCTYAGTPLTKENVSMLLEDGIECPDNVTFE